MPEAPSTSSNAAHAGAGWGLLAICCGLQAGAVLLMKAANVYVGGPFWQRATSPLFVGAILAMGAQFFTWRMVLTKLPISIAYPATAIVVPLNLAGGVALFGERLSAGEIVGGAIVALGVAILSRSQATSSPEDGA